MHGQQDILGQENVSISVNKSRGFRGLAARGVEMATILIMAAEVVVVSAGVTWRYLLNRPIAGLDEVANLLLVWLTFLGGAVAQRKGCHPSVSFLTDRLPLSFSVYVKVAVHLIDVIFFGSVCALSLRLLQLRLGEASAGAGFDMSWYPCALLLGAAVTCLYSLGQLASMPRRPLAAILGGAAVLSLAVGAALRLGLFDPSRLNSTLLLIGGFLVLLAMNAPLATALGLPSFVYLGILGGPNLLMLPQRLIAGVDSFVLLAIPLFILAGALMETGGISRRLVDLAMALVGHFRGGLAQVTVIGEVLFSGISGSTTADVAAMGALMIPSMEAAGYDREEAISIVSAASAMGILVPPCLLMVIVATIADLSVTALFLAGFLPAAVLALALMALIHWKARRQGWPVASRASTRMLGRAFLHALMPLILPAIIFGSIFSGAATVTESAVLAVLYAVLVGVFIYRETAASSMPKLLLESATMSAMGMWMIASASVFTWLLARDQVPQAISGVILSISHTPWFFLLASVAMFTVFAALLEGFPAVIILAPIFFPIAAKMGVNPLHFSIVIIASVGIGLFLPPLGVGLFVACGIGRSSITRVTAPFLPYLLVLVLGLLVVTFVPRITMILPEWMLHFK